MIKKANENRIKMINAGRKALEEQSKPLPQVIPDPQPIKEEIKPIAKPPPIQHIEEEPITEREIREYIRLKKKEEDGG